MRVHSGAALVHLVATPGPTGRAGRETLSTAIKLSLQTDERLLITVVEAARRLEISRSKLYELLTTGEIESIHVGRLRRIPADGLTDYVERRRYGSPEPAA